MRTTFLITDEYRQNHLIETGTPLPKKIQLEVPLQGLSKKSLQIIAIAFPSLPDTIDLQIPRPLEQSLNGYYTTSWEANTIPGTKEEWDAFFFAYWQAYTTISDQNAAKRQKQMDAILANLHEVVQSEKYNESTYNVTGNFHENIPSELSKCDGYEEAKQLLKTFLEHKKAIDDAAAQVRREKEAAQAAEKKAAQQKRDDEKAAWIAAHGSNGLRKRFPDYDCKELYVKERAALEYPEYWVDYKDNAQWDDIACPNDESLTEAERVNGTVVFLTRLPSTSDFSGFFRSQQAVVIRGFLGEYDLINLIPSDEVDADEEYDEN